MRALYFTEQNAELIERASFGVDEMQALLDGMFDGLPLPSPDPDLPAADARLYLYMNATADYRPDFTETLRLGREGRVLRGPVLLVGLHNSLNRDLTERELHEIRWTSFEQPGPIPVLDAPGWPIVR